MAIINHSRMGNQYFSEPLPEFVSQQVTEARRFFLNLAPTSTTSLEVVCGGVERMRPDYVVDRIDFPYFAMELVAEGGGELTIGGDRYALAPGTIFAYGPGVPHVIRNHPDNGMRKYYLDFVGTQSEELLNAAGLVREGREFTVVEVGRTHELIHLFEMLIRDASENGPMVSEICNALVRLLFLKIRQSRLRSTSEMPKAFATFERVRQFIEENFLQLDKAQDIAEGCGITPVYLSRLFGRFGDCGAHQFLMRRKMNYAAGLLMNEGLLVKEVASRLGFTDPFQFSRSFKRVYGIPPTAVNSVPG